ncbi:hypothetical protein GCM10007984_35290 [Shewanella putrefaciens]|nr:hypothetical protein GCM10007984_35290 [Shewanella putrefaciens]
MRDKLGWLTPSNDCGFTSINSIIKRCTPRAKGIQLNLGWLIELHHSKSWGFTPHPTKEDCPSYPPWMLQDAPSEVTCISY